jgi:hypothetical protein
MPTKRIVLRALYGKKEQKLLENKRLCRSHGKTGFQTELEGRLRGAGQRLQEPIVLYVTMNCEE